MEILKVKPWGKDQGDHVLINKCDFDPSFHELFDAPEKAEDTPEDDDQGKRRGRPRKAAE